LETVFVDQRANGIQSAARAQVSLNETNIFRIELQQEKKRDEEGIANIAQELPKNPN
jgi:hypothetical protein